MRTLLDTHTLLWWWEGSARLSARARSILLDDAHDVFVSPVSFWEIARKVSIGKLVASIPLDRMEAVVGEDGFRPLPLTLPQGLRAGRYAQVHRDPFDRLLAAQAELEGLTLLTRDPAFRAFPCETLWD